ncbi:MAG: hypothetical protein PWQ85_696 [Geotoga sp.]|jgi:hypothetical protein|nr:hypothetical protein [Geotoga sp.]
MLIKKFKLIYEEYKLKKYVKLLKTNSIEMPKKIKRDVLFLENYKDNSSLIKSVQKNLEKGIFYYVFFIKKKNLKSFDVKLISQIVDFFGIHLFFIGKDYYYLYQNMVYKKGLQVHLQKNIDKRFVFLEEKKLLDITALSICNLTENSIVFTNSLDEELMQNFSNATFSIVINVNGKIFKPIAFNNIIELKSNYLKLNFEELESLKNKLKQKDVFGEKVLKLINK